jgi:hypothetical protein
MEITTDLSTSDGIVSVRRASKTDLPVIMELVRSYFGENIASAAVVEKVHNHNHDTAWAVVREPADQPVGCYLLVMLSEGGFQAYQAETFDPLDPDLSHIVPSGVRPAAIYAWGIVARKLAAQTNPLMSKALRKEIYGGVPIVARAATPGGHLSANRYGFAQDEKARTATGDRYRLEMPQHVKPRSGLG